MFTTRTPPEATCETHRVPQLRAAIAARLARGDTLETVERELIVPSRLPEEQQSALWLYAGSHPNRRPATDQVAGVKSRLGSTARRYVEWQLSRPDDSPRPFGDR